MKRKLDLRTGNPVWTRYRAASIPHKQLHRDIKTDILIVGAGVSGALIAEMLTAEGLVVTVIDRRAPMRGSTAATTALVQSEIDVPLTLLADKIGKAKAQAAWRRSRLAIANLKARIEELSIRCDLCERPSLLLPGDLLDMSGLRKEVEERRAAGLYADYLGRAVLKSDFGISKPGAVLTPGNLALDPRKLTAGLLVSAIGRGAQVYSPVEALRFKETKSGVAVETKDGPVINANEVVLATGYELTDVAPSKNHSIVSTWAIATRPQPTKIWPRQALIWEAAETYLYLRALPDGRVICGGEDEDFEDEHRRDALLEEKAQTISRKLKRLMPQLDTTPEFAWTGSFGTTSTGLPIIGKIQSHPRIHCMMGYGGNGITFSRIAAELVTSAIMGKKDGDAALFAPGALL